MKLPEPKTIFVDIDGTICQNRDDLRKEDIDTPVNYNNVTPYPERIREINELYDAGNKIVYWTARGCVSGTDYTELTRDQLLEWGAKYHDLQVGNKPFFDMYICDKSFNSETFFHRKKMGYP